VEPTDIASRGKSGDAVVMTVTRANVAIQVNYCGHVYQVASILIIRRF
jgi:hypothetical protein